jgi:hypothetical protein
MAAGLSLSTHTLKTAVRQCCSFLVNTHGSTSSTAMPVEVRQVLEAVATLLEAVATPPTLFGV